MKPLLAIACLALCGCTTRTLYYQGLLYEQTSFGTKQTIGELSASSTTNGIVIRIKGYSADGSETLGLLAEKLAEGAVKGAKP